MLPQALQLKSRKYFVFIKIQFHISEFYTLLSYLGRRVPRSEVAKRISNLDAGLLNRVATRWFWDKELALVTWGPSHGLMAGSHYNRNIKRSTLGWYGNSHYYVV